MKNIVWKMLQNSSCAGKVAKVKANPSNHSNQVRVWFTEKTLDDVMGFEEGMNKILSSEPSPFTSIEYDPTRSGSKTYATWLLHLKPALGQRERDAFADCGALDAIEGGQTMQLCYALSSKSILKTKDLDPSAFGLTGGVSYTEESLVAAVLDRCKSAPEKSSIALFERYIRHCIAAVTGNSSVLEPVFHKGALQIADIVETDLNCANKDFGEIVCAISVLHRTKGMAMTVVFSEAENERLADFRLVSRDGLRNYYYSVKNKGKNKGTAGSILDSLWDEYAAANEWEKGNPESKGFRCLVKLLRKNANDTRTKLFQCANFVAKRLPQSSVASCLSGLQAALGRIGEGSVPSNLQFSKASSMLENAVSKIVSKVRTNLEKNLPKPKRGKSSLPLKTLEDAVRNEFMSQNGDGRKILDAMSEFRKAFMNVAGETEESVYKMLVPGFKGAERKLMYPKFGLFVYPIGAHLARSLNEPVNGQTNGFLAALNRCLGWHKNFVQIDTDISISCKSGKAELVVVQPKWNRFSKSVFKFEYNGMSKNSGNNRPLNFIMDHK